MLTLESLREKMNANFTDGEGKILVSDYRTNFPDRETLMDWAEEICLEKGWAIDDFIFNSSDPSKSELLIAYS